MKKGLTRLVAALLFALLMPSMVFAGYEISQSQTGMHGASKSKIFISKNKYMVIQPESQMSVNFATQRISITNESQKTYWEGTIDEYIKSMEEMQDFNEADEGGTAKASGIAAQRDHGHSRDRHGKAEDKRIREKSR